MEPVPVSHPEGIKRLLNGHNEFYNKLASYLKRIRIGGNSLSKDYSEIIEKTSQEIKRLEEEAIYFYQMEKGLIEKPRRNGKNRLSFDKVKKGYSEKVEEERKKRADLKPKLVEQNEMFHFRPVKTAIQLTNEAISHVDHGLYEEAIPKFIDSLEHFSFSKELIFNLGRARIESGDYEGLFDLLDYWFLTEEGDYYHDQLQQIFHLQSDGNLHMGSIIGKTRLAFEVQDDMAEITEGMEEFEGVSIPLPYKVPVSLELERKDKQDVKLFDYDYLKEWTITGERAEHHQYEVVLPISVFRLFLNQFAGTIVKLSHGHFKELTAFSELYLREEKYQHEQLVLDPPDRYDAPMASYALVQIPQENNKEFLNDYRQFVDQYVTKEMSDEEQDAREEAYFANQAEVEAHMERSIELQEQFQRFSNNADHYGKLVAYLDNLKKNTEKPYESLDEARMEEARKEYLSLFGDVFEGIFKNRRVTRMPSPPAEDLNEEKIEVSPNRKVIDKLLGKIVSDDIKIPLDSELSPIIEVIPVSPKSALSHMRIVLEILLVKSVRKLGLDPDGETLFNLMNSTIYTRNKKIDDYMHEIRKTVNQHGAHFDESKQFSVAAEKIDQKRVEALLEKLLEVVEFYVKRFKF